jgi:hypothetical protein
MQKVFRLIKGRIKVKSPRTTNCPIKNSIIKKVLILYEKDFFTKRKERSSDITQQEEVLDTNFSSLTEKEIRRDVEIYRALILNVYRVSSTLLNHEI